MQDNSVSIPSRLTVQTSTIELDIILAYAKSQINNQKLLEIILDLMKHFFNSPVVNFFEFEMLLKPHLGDDTHSFAFNIWSKILDFQPPLPMPIYIPISMTSRKNPFSSKIEESDEKFSTKKSSYPLQSQYMFSNVELLHYLYKNNFPKTDINSDVEIYDI